MEENNLILNDALRNLTKKIFYYGSYSATDFEKEKISKKVSFDQYKQELTRILGEWIEEVPDTTPPALHHYLNFQVISSLYPASGKVTKIL